MLEILNQIQIFLKNQSHQKKLIIAIDGIDASGKTYFAEALKNYLEIVKIKSEIIHLDDFHNPKLIRYHKGEFSAVGFYEDSYNYDVFINESVIPFKLGKDKILLKYFNLNEDVVEKSEVNVSNTNLLIVEGIFAQRKELYNYWDFTLFLEVPFEESLKRNIERDKNTQNDIQRELVIQKYHQRYKAGQLIYFEKENPQSKSDLLIDNTDVRNPKLLE